MRQPCTAMDVLFVIDNSGSMSGEQANLAANFPGFLQVLEQLNEGSFDYRVGVTTTSFDQPWLFGLVSPGEEGALLQTTAMQRPWLERGDPNFEQTFADLATVGVQGAGTEQPLRAVRSALIDQAGPAGPNARFLREDALLAIVILTDEDDFSTDDGEPIPVVELLQTFDEIKQLRDRWSLAVFAGDQSPLCMSDFGSASYAPRLREFVDAAGDNATLSSICEGDLAGPLSDALDVFERACRKFVEII